MGGQKGQKIANGIAPGLLREKAERFLGCGEEEPIGRWSLFMYHLNYFEPLTFFLELP
jgi:hypothetical protein